jgi:Protein of unknown function (DUF3987)
VAKKPPAPIPYDENAAEDQFWRTGKYAYEDPWDRHLPHERGFVHDFVAHLRGHETPTAFCLWSAIFFIASAVKREAWVRWGDGRLYPNLYLMFIGPPGIVKKGTAIEHGYHVFMHVHDHMKDAYARARKENEIKKCKDGTKTWNFKVLKDKATAEAILTKMTPAVGKHTIGVNGKAVAVFPTSEICIVVPELAVMLGKKEYMQNTTEVLMSLYDGLDFQYNTVGRGTVEVRDPCTFFIAATTPKGLQQSVPTVATEDGFISRCILVYQGRSERRFIPPRRAGPDDEELAKRLAWIADNTLGEHTLADDAQVELERWYNVWKDRLEQDDTENPFSGSRLDIQVVKLSLVLKASRYAEGKVISAQDVRDAIHIIEHTTLTARGALEEVHSNAFREKMNRVEVYIARRCAAGKVVQRWDVMRSTHTVANDLDIILSNLEQEDKITITQGINKAKQIYQWNEDQE